MDSSKVVAYKLNYFSCPKPLGTIAPHLFDRDDQSSFKSINTTYSFGNTQVEWNRCGNPQESVITHVAVRKKTGIVGTVRRVSLSTAFVATLHNNAHKK